MGLLQIVQYGACGEQGYGNAVTAKRRSRCAFELVGNQPLAVVSVVDPLFEVGDGPVYYQVRYPLGLGVFSETGGKDDFTGRDAGHFGQRRLQTGEFGNPELAGGKVEIGKAEAVVLRAERQQIVVFLGGEGRILDDESRCDDFDHLALDDTLRQFRILGLLADGNLFARLDKFGDVGGA